MYYADKIPSLRDIFGAASVTVNADGIVVDGRTYPVLDDVIILDGGRAPPAVRQKLAHAAEARATPDAPFDAGIQATFGAEWQKFPDILPEHEREFRQYFDVVPPALLQGKRTCDLGCGIGRWSHFVRDTARELMLVDFSEAIFVARRNLRGANALFFLGDITQLPFRNDCADVVICLGVLHHLPVDALQQTRRLARYAPHLLIYLYSKLDGRPAFWRALFVGVDLLRRAVSHMRSPALRGAFTWTATLLLYMPLVALGHLLQPLGLARFVPLFEFYRNKSVKRLRQDVYDRFFTSIEQRVSRAEILSLRDTFARIDISEQIPQWHFLCHRHPPQ